MNCSVAKTTRKVNTDRTNWDVDAQANIEQVSESINEKVRANNYSSVAWRNEAVQHSAVFGAKVLDKVRRQANQKVTGSMKSFLKNAIRIELSNVVIARIAREKGNTTKEFKEEIKKQLGYDAKTGIYAGNVAYVSEILKGTSESNDNIIAWYNEAFNNAINEDTGLSYADEFFLNVFSHQKLGSVKFEKDDTFGEYKLAEALSVTEDNEVNEPENGENPTDTNPDDTIAAFEHSGEHKDFMIGVDQDIKNYFNTLNKLKSSEKAGNKWQLDKENLYEIVNTMDARSCSSVLFHQGDFTDDVAMVESIKRIARQCAGFEAFMKFAEDLEKDADFRYKVYNSFAKRIMSKLETVVDEKNGKPNLANKRSNAVTALAFEFRNTIKSTAVSVNNYEVEDRYEALNKTLMSNPNIKYSEFLNKIATQPNDEDVLAFVGELTSLLQVYYPTIDKYGVANYLYNATDVNGKVNVSANLSNLKNILSRTIQAAKRTAVAYNSLQYDIATEKNRKKKQALYNTDYVDNSNYQEAQALAELLAPYSVVRVDLNSRNTEGKLSSDVLNNNFLTNFINTLQSTLNRKFKDAEGNVTYAQDCPLQHFKEFKFKSTQYNLSNILVEKIEDGRVVNRGLFRREGNDYVPTEYATDLLRISKFNGATSFDNGKNTLYSKMSKADYITTAFINFFNTDGSINGTPMANYFMRIPSDSGTQFVVTAPRYQISQTGPNALRTSDGKINRNHPIFKQFKYAFLQELIDMGDAINTIFVTDENGVVTRAHKNGKDVLQFNPGFENKPTSKLYKKYHYDGEVVKGFGTDNETLTGNVFKSNKFTIVKADGTEINYGQKFIDNFIDFLYGGGISTNTNESVKFIREKTTDEKGNIIYGRVIGVNLDAQSQDFKNGLDAMIENFIADYTREAINRIQSSKKFIKESNSSLFGEDKEDKEFNRKVSEFALNTHLMYMNFDDLFEGSSKFYGSAQDFLKRAKEVQGSGVPYGIVNYNNSFTITAKTPKEGALLNSKEVIDRIGNIGQYDSFRAVTIVNTVRTPVEAEYKKADGSGKDGVLVKKLSQNFATQAGRKRPNENDKQRARNMMAGFAGAKVNDAQSYITFEEWVRRIAARGQLMKHLPLIEKIQKGETLTDTEMDAFVQVQKNFYYDQYYDKQTGVIVPRQIKNAEFVLVPQFIKGTQLEQIYNLMKKHDIDQLNTEETSKAGKHNVLTLWDNEGNLTQKNLDDFDAKADGAAEYFNYNYLYTQQETPQHVNAENKAGIQIMKKIIDNIPVGHKLYPVKQRFMELYSANVQSAFNTLMSELNVETDENGYPILNEDGQIKGLDYKKLYDMFREEAERLGVDSNLSDYFTLDEQVLDNVAQTLMPNFFSNVSSRVESVAQALFNSRITRQKLPGFHGAQVTQIGFKKENIQTSDALRYHSRLTEDGKEVYSPYIEVMLPKSNFGLSEYDDNTALKMLQEAGADELIGYRIPTEGKQSVGVMKVVGFTNDAQGSTIIVPDGWVPQTGSDFDIDSIYGIQWHMYVGKDGKLKVPFMSTSDEDVTKRWHSYIARNVEVPNAFENIDQDLAEYRETIENKETFTEFAEVQRNAGEAFLELNGKFKALVAQINRDFKDDNDKASYKEHLQNLIDKLEEEIAKPQYARGVWRNAEGKTLTDKEFDKLSEEEQEEYDWVHGNRDTVLEVSNYIQSLKDIVNFLDTQAEVNVAYSKIKQVTEFLHATQDRLYEDAAKNNGLMSLEEFSKLDINMQNSKSARDNEILNCMMTILKDDSSLEENLGRSNFDDISNTDEDNLGAIQKMMSPTERSRRQKRSPYNFFDQADYQDDAMSGAKLKGFSVTRDNLCSVCNTVRPVVKTDAYIMLYDATKYDLKQLKETFGEQNVNLSRDKKYIQVRHKTFGWSRNNKNVVGRILTSYSSETTAHILDAIKEGAAPNVNDFTFAVYKSFVDVGSDYDTAIGFMAQPAVSRIVSAYNNNKSIFTGFNTNPIQQAIRSLAGEIGIKTTEKKGKTTKGVSLNKIVKAINENEELGKAFEELFGVKLDIKSIKGNEAEFENFALPTYLLKNRIDESGVFASSPVEESKDSTSKAIESSGDYPVRTKENITWSDITLSFAADETTPGERLTEREAVNQGKYYNEYTPNGLNVTDIKRRVKNFIISLGNDQSFGHKGKTLPKENIKLNIAGNGIYDLKKYNITQEDLNDYVTEYLKELMAQGVTISEIRSGGQTGVDEAGIIAAQRLGLKWSVNAPKGWKFRDINGRDISDKKQFLDRFGISEEETIEGKVEVSGKTLQQAFDLGILLKYFQYAQFSQRIGDVARVMNPDKFGAKKNIYETSKVFDDIQELIDKGDMSLVVRTEQGEVISILEAVYPGIGDGDVETFMKANPERKSAYPPLYSFLKYATAPSVVINRTLFETQNEDFVKAVNMLEVALGFGSRISEKQYTDYQKYILGEIYSEIPFIKHPVVFNPKDNTFDVEIPADNDTKEEKERKSKQGEVARIYGFGAPSDIDFKPQRLYKPTKADIEKWRRMSPAQKVLWIQQNAKNPGIFGLFKVDLRNDNRDGSQTIEFAEDSVNIEDAYSMFNNAFYNENPLIRLAAADLIKYSFVVEGFQMSQHAVNKVIRNTPLIQSIEEGGTGIVSYMRDAVRDVRHQVNTKEALMRYVRSHDVQGMPKVKINDLNPRALVDENNWETYTEVENGQKVERQRHPSTGVLIIQLNDNNIATLIENNMIQILDNGDIDYCSFFKTTGRKGKTYRFEIKNGVAYAYPLNKLQPNEHTEWSTRLDNNEQPSAEYFEAIIDGKTDTSKKAEFMSPVTYKVQRVANFEMSELKDNTVSKINNASSEILKGNVYYLWSPELAEKLPKPGDMTVQEIDGVVYDITRAGTKIADVQKKYLGENKDVTIASRDVAYNDLINNPNYGLRAMGFKKPSLDIFQVKAHKSVEVVITPEEMMSDTTEDLGELSVYAIFDNAAQGDRIAEDARRMLSERGINKENHVGSTEDGLFIISNYLNRVVDRINDQLQHFQTEDGRTYKVTDPELIDYIRNNPEERRRYLKLLLDARKIKRQFEAYSAFDTSSHDPMLKRYLDNIKKKVVELDEALTSNGLKLFANDYLAKVSSNPLLKWNNKLESDIITLLDGFYGSSMIEAMINDTQEMPNPLIQIITKEVMADIRAKEMAAEERVSEFEKTVAAIKKEAEAAGMSINWDNIVDKTGKLIQPYKDSFIDDYAALRKNVEDIKNTRLPDGTIDYKALNKAQLALDKWLNDNVELALKGDTKDEFGLPIKSFYTKKIELEQNMINNHEEIFARYKALLAKRRDIVSHLNTNDSDPRWEKELKDVDLELKGLTASMNYDPDSHTFSSKTGKELEDAKALSNYKTDIKKLYDEYYDKEENAGFREDLEENLRIVKEAERRDKYGVPQASQEELKHNERYQQAATWLKKNAIFSPDPEVYEKVNAAFRALRNGSKKSKTSEILKLVATNADAYDVKGRVDGRKLNVEQQRNLTKTQQEEYNNQANADSVAASLINSAGEVDEVYTKDFYKLLYREGYAKSAEYKAKVKEINDILSQHYGNSKTINWVDMTTDELNKLANLYRELREIKEDIEFSWSSRYAKLHSENIDYVINQENFDIARNAAELAGMDMNLWDAVNTEFVIEDGKKVRKPNRLIYGKAVPTAEARAKKNAKTGKLIYIDEAKTEALKTIRGYMVTEPSEYYFEEYARRKKEGVDADGRTFEEWYADNHVYNPYSRTMIPNRSWMVSRLNDANEGTWEPGFNQTHSIPKEEYKNPNHKDGISLGINYKDNGGKYKNDVHQNEYEKKLQAEVYNLLMALAKVETAKRFFEEGNMPIMSKDEEHDLRFYLKEAAKGVGWIEDTNTGKEFDENINYANDYIPSMPMTAKLRDVKIEAKKPEKPEFKEGDDVDEYNKKLDEYNKALAKYEAEREKYNQDQLNRNWEEVIKRFIKEAAHYNAVQDNRLMLYYGQEILKNQMMYDTNLGKSNLKIDDRKSKGKKVVYQTRDSKREYEQYTNWLRRLMFNQWKHNNPRWTRWANLMQSFTSANFMMMNIRGGIANVTLGETQILAEAFAKEYFGTKEYLKGKAIWMSNVPDYLSHMYDEKSSTVAGALIKFMNVVDFDEWTGVVHADLDPATYLKRARDMMFSPQTMGEHFMQNGAMFSIMLSHRLYENKNPELNGKTKYIVKGRAEVIRDAHEDALFEILKDNEALKKEFEEFRKSQLSDDNVRKEFAWFRKDMTTEFMERLDKDKQKKFIELRKDFENKALEDFDKQPDVMSQFKLGDNGKLAFADGSILFQLNNSAETNSDVNDAYKILGALKGRIISVNKKIHGVYDRMGSAQLEKYWWGALAMQYHKHIYPGIMKRYRKHGYYNEERGTIEKGCYNALIDFLAIPIRKYRQDMKDNEVTGMEGLQNLFKHVADFCMNVSIHWNLLPDYERANVRRNLGDIVGVLAAVAVAIGLRALGDDDDEDGIIYNLCLYEADRLASESFQFNPYGAWVEAKKLWSNPVAVESIINDIRISMGVMSQILLEGEDYDPYYHSGKYSGEHKLKVYVERRIPVWRGINAIANIADDNHYYKLGDNMISIIPVKDIANWIKE